MADAEWDDFLLRHTRVETSPVLTIQTKGTASFNNATFEALGEPASLIFRYDRANNRIGLRAGAGEEHAYPVRRVGAHRTWILSMIAFLKHNGLPIGEVRRLKGEMEGDTLVFDLADTAHDAQRRRR